MTRQIHEALRKIYRDPSDAGSFGGVNRLLKSARDKGLLDVTKDKVKKYLESDDAYTLHKPIRKHFKRNPTIVGGIDHQWQADLADVSDISRFNDGNRYLLTVIDCFSKYAWAIPMKRKDASATVDGFRKLFFDSAPRKPKRLQTDKGKEFLNRDVQSYLKQLSIAHFTTNSETKAAIVERFNRTLKTKMFTYFTANNTSRYLDVLPDLLKAYNKSFHRSIGMKPCDVRSKDENKIWNKLYGKHAATASTPKHIVPKEQVIRISKTKTTFDKGYLPNWTQELFKVKDSVANRKRVYKVKDYADEDIAGSFYPEEIQAVTKPKNTEFLIEKVLKKRKGLSGTEVFVKWKGWPIKFNSWINEADAHGTRSK